jgi:hypothetical protein
MTMAPITTVQVMERRTARGIVNSSTSCKGESSTISVQSEIINDCAIPDLVLGPRNGKSVPNWTLTSVSEENLAVILWFRRTTL